MRKKKIIFVIVILLLFFCARKTFAIFKSFGQRTNSIPTAVWSVSRNHSSSSDSIDLIKEHGGDDYTLTVQSNSEVDVTYSVIISNLPVGVEVDLDGVTYTQSNNEIRINDVDTIYYSDQTKTRTHTLTFRATSGSTVISNQQIDIDVEFSQTV
jgi:hypothetical protein